MKKLVFASLFFISLSAYAVVPTTDIYQSAQDTTTTSGYVAQIPGYLSKMNTTMNAAQQVQSLHGLAAVQGAGSQICNMCNASDLASMQNYVKEINGDLCSQFSAALSNITGSQQAITSLQGVMSAFASNPKAAGLALQQASVATQSATQNTMAQMQMLSAQAQQKKLAQEKYTNTMVSNSAGMKTGL